MKKTIIIILSFLILLPIFANAESDPVFAFENFEYEVIVGKVVKITPIMQNIENNKKATYTWSSSDESIATVKKGTVKGIKRGKAKIECIATLKDGGTYIASCTVNVIQPIKKVSVEESNLVLLIDDAYKPEVKFTPENASNKNLIWTTSNPDIATVEDNGTIHPLSIGKCKIKAQTTDGTKKALTLNVSVPEVVIEEDKYTVSTPEGIEVPYWTQGYGNYSFAWTTDYFDVKIGEGVNNFAKWEAPMYERAKRSVIIIPVKAGTGYLWITNIGALGGGTRPLAKIKIKIEHDAVFDNISYPKTSYKKLTTNEMIGKQVGIKGTVHSVKEKNSQFYYYIIMENKNDQIIVAISNSNEELRPEQIITIYGVVERNFHDIAETGLLKSYPCVELKRVMK